MVVALYRFDEYVFDIRLQHSVVNLVNNLLTIVFYVVPTVVNPKGHDNVGVNAIIGIWCYVKGITFFHFDMFVARISVHETQDFMVRGDINQLIDHAHMKKDYLG